MLDKQGYESNKGVQVVVALGSDDGCAGCWVVLLFSLCTVTDLHTHLGTQPEEARDQVVRLQNTLLVHLSGKKSETI